jgi:hypothetical protein
MTPVRLFAIGGLIGIAAMMSGGASAQDCPGWLKWACPDSASSSRAARGGIRREQQPSRAPAKQQARPAADGATPQQRRSPEATSVAKAAGQARRGEASGDRRLARYRERQGTRLDPTTMSAQEKAALFQEFVEWQKAQR